MTIDDNYVKKLCNSVAKTMLDAFQSITIEDVNMYQLGYKKAIDDVNKKLGGLRIKHTEKYGADIIEVYADLYFDLCEFIDEQLKKGANE